MKVVMASNNAHKIAELRAILSAYGLDVVSQREAGVHVGRRRPAQRLRRIPASRLWL